MRPIHVFLSVLVAALWGFNYVAVPIGLEKIPPLFLSCIRLFLISLTAVFFVKKPDVPFKMVLFYGLTMFAMQFGFLFSGIHAGLSPTLAPLLLQTQVFFTAALAFVYLKEKLSKWQISGALIAFSGILLVSIDSGGEATLLGVILVLAAALSWGIGNIVCKKIGKVDLSLVIWGSLIAWPPVLLISVYIEGVKEIEQSFAHVSFSSIRFHSLSYLWIVVFRLLDLEPSDPPVPFGDNRSLHSLSARFWFSRFIYSFFNSIPFYSNYCHL